MKPRHGHISENCRPISEVMSLIGDKWTSLIITRLHEGPMRFNALKRRVEGISQKVLTSSLRALERDGFLDRRVYPTVPPRVEYSLTPMGHELAGPLMALTDFALRNRDRMDAAQAAYDEKNGIPQHGAPEKRKPQPLRLN